MTNMADEVNELIETMEKQDLSLDWKSIPEAKGVEVLLGNDGIFIERRQPETAPPELEVSARHGEIDDCIYVKLILRHGGEYPYTKGIIVKIPMTRVFKLAEAQQIPIVALPR